MPPLLTQVARVSDGLPLVATMTGNPGMPVTSKQQQEAKDILRSLTHQSPGRMSIVSDAFTFYYMVRESLCYLTMTESSYPKRSAFLYLEDVADAILMELTNEFQNNWHSEIDQTARPFRFIHYDPIIQRLQRGYRDVKGGNNTNANKSQLREDLGDIHNIMRKNIDEILNRGEKLENVSNISADLQQKSRDFKWGAKKLTWQARLQQYGPVVGVSSMVLMVIYYRFFM
mmetsp:Transcript_3570/g.4136  ORF Transcript_3570/g.4136 Transcript_3570/m.4136 type:complete len:229 (+) Transcript_3570:49-735(+)|eukprot:CAMPEP_0194134644 /NCGR_PEP_ID=MMETSP0152-20130528/4718_1 /TAXON_ID=1049557 /ORGANISM="Thalassiothrix antarctica, Strain L6-D1" /LENGTH=228 /DNA_ID=CAMNT_0038830473 /DNA_START=188 /DNA_END=874 /DNA_ORIENTATION=+